MGLNDIARDAYNTDLEKGFWDTFRTFGDLIALCHSELSEALDEWRNNQPPVYRKDGKPEGWAVEVIDCVLRCLILLYGLGIDNIDEILEAKMRYNKERPYRHGGKRI